MEKQVELSPEIMSLLRQVKEAALEPTLVDPPRIIYHYTDVRGLEGILSSGRLWATVLGCLSDKEEANHPVEFCRHYLNDALEQESRKKRLFLEQVVRFHHAVESAAHELEHQAAASLTKRNDLRSQWDAYAVDGSGYALGFNSYWLVDILGAHVKDPNSTTDVNWAFRTMVYTDEEKRRLLDGVLQKIYADPLFHDPGDEDTAKAVEGIAVYGMALAAGAFKRPQFALEHEMRLTVANQRELVLGGTPLPSKKRRDKSRGGLEYLEVDICEPTSGCLPLVEVLAGPKADAGVAEKAVAAAADRLRTKPSVRKMSLSDLK